MDGSMRLRALLLVKVVYGPMRGRIGDMLPLLSFGFILLATFVIMSLRFVFECTFMLKAVL